MKRINSLEELKEEAAFSEYDVAEFCIMLTGGLRSSKRATYFPNSDTYDVHNEIDGSWQEDLTEEQLRSETYIPYAIENGAFYKYEWQK